MEEHARRWNGFEPGTEGGILPVANWASVFTLNSFSRRLDPDYLSRLAEYGAESFPAFLALGSGPYWEIPSA
ncbi:MAG: hypothetical protein AB7T37_08655 [Dehalococcoidia bacterium]